MSLHPYDGKERRFRHTYAETKAGLAIVAQLLGLSNDASISGALYDLSFFSGGLGIIDQLAITVQADQSIWTCVTAKHQAQTLEQASQNADWVDELVWLLTDEETPLPLCESAVQFINSERHEFQAECFPTHRLLFADGSGVNWWIAFWGDETTLNFLGYDQG
jgi:hypothetical protein